MANSGSRLFPGRDNTPSVSTDQIDFSVDFYLASGTFEKINDRSVYADRVRQEVAEPLVKLKNMLADSSVIDTMRVAEYLADAYMSAEQFVLSVESTDYLADFYAEDREVTAGNVLDDLWECFETIAKGCNAQGDFAIKVTEKRKNTSIKPRSITVPYGAKSFNDENRQALRPPFLAHENGSESKRHFGLSATDELPAAKVMARVKEASLAAAEKTVREPTERPAQKTPAQSPHRDSMPPAPAEKTAPANAAESAGTMAKKFFKTHFLALYKEEYLRKVRESGSSNNDGKGTPFEDAFEYLCRKTYLTITEQKNGKPEAVALVSYVEKKTASGSSWRDVIRSLGETAVENAAKEELTVHVPIITAAYLSGAKHRDIIKKIKEGDARDYEAKLEDASQAVGKYIYKNMFNPNTAKEIESLAFLSYFFRENRSDLGNLLFKEIQKAARDCFDKLRNMNVKDVTASMDAERSCSEDREPVTLRGSYLDALNAQTEENGIAVSGSADTTNKNAADEKNDEAEALRNLGSDDLDEDTIVDNNDETLSGASTPDKEMPSVLVEGMTPQVIQGKLEKGDEDEDTDVFIYGGQRKVFPKITPAAGRPVEKQKLPRFTPDPAPVITFKNTASRTSKCSINGPEAVKPVEQGPYRTPGESLKPQTTDKKKGPEVIKQPYNTEKESFWSRMKRSRAAKTAGGVILAASTILAGYGLGIIGNPGKTGETDSTANTAGANGANSYLLANDAGPEKKDTTANENLTKPAGPEENTSAAEKPAGSDNAVKYSVHTEKVAGKDTRLKKLLATESLTREAGNRGDFEQLHNIVAQGALTAAQQNKLQDELNGKYNRGEYGNATKRFRPLLENGQLFRVLGNANHPEHSALKEAVDKFGNPSYWSWNRKKPVMENGRVSFVSVPYEELHSADVEFYNKCQSEFKQIGLGKDGNVHYRGGEAGENIPLKINGKWITFVETALEIRGVLEVENTTARDIPAPPENIFKGKDSPNQNVPTNIVPTSPQDFQPASPGPQDGGTGAGVPGKTGLLNLEDPVIEVGEEVEVDLADLDDSPVIEVGEEDIDDETLMAEVDDAWDNIWMEKAVAANTDRPDDSPMIEIGEETEVDLADLDDSPMIEIGEEVEVDLADLDDSPVIEVGEEDIDDETLMAEVDDAWDNIWIENAVEKTVKKVRLMA